MENKKLSLEEIKVESFVTEELQQKEKETIEGGLWSMPPACVPLTSAAINPLMSVVATVSLTIASYAQCRKIGEDIGDAYSKNLCGDSMGFWCKIITV